MPLHGAKIVDCGYICHIFIHMKAIQIMMEPRLLADLDATEEVRRKGRSAVLRQAVAEYLQRRRNDEIREGYRRAYGVDGGLGAEYAGWEEQSAWPDG